MALTTEAAARKNKLNAGATMEHRHFATIASIIANMPLSFAGVVTLRFADELAHTNPKFDRARFLRACAPARLRACAPARLRACGVES